MQQSSATQSLHLSFWGLRKIVACSHSSLQCLLVSTVFGMVSSLHPTSFLMIFTLVYIAMQLSSEAIYMPLTCSDTRHSVHIVWGWTGISVSIPVLFSHTLCQN